MVMMLKKIRIFFILFLPWYLIPILCPVDWDYYHSLNLPLSLPPLFFIIIWTMIYIFVATVSTKLYLIYGKEETKEYFRSLCFNYILNSFFLYFFFSLKSPFLGFTDSVILFISTLLCFYETKELEHSLKYYFIPYLLLTLGTSIFLLFTVFMNL